MSTARAGRASRGVWVVLLAVLAVGGRPGAARGQKEDLTSTLRTAVKQVAVFKNGYGLFFRQGKARPMDRWLHADHLPYASLGTMWIYSLGKKDVVDRVISAKQTKLSFSGGEALSRLLAERVGSSLALETVDGKQHTGKLSALTEGMALLEGEGTLVAVKLDTVQNATLVDLPLRIKVTTDDEVEIAMTYLQTGIRWLPSYVVRLVDDGKAELMLRASLVNDAEDLEDSSVHFVVGVPSFAFEGEVDPLALNRVAAAIQPRFTVSAARGQARVDAEAARGEGAAAPTPAVPPTLRDLPDLPGEDLGELYMYELANVDLKVGEVGMLTVFSETAPYRQVYEWEAESEDVWQCVELTNNTSMPWTTGPAAVYSDWRMLGQNTLKYTPPKAKKRLPVTITRNIGVSKEEEELDRQPKVIRRDGYEWDLVTLKASLAMTSYQERKAEIAVTKTVTGELVEASDEPEVTHASELLQRFNPTSLLKWTVTVPPGETKTLTYTYKVYVH